MIFFVIHICFNLPLCISFSDCYIPVRMALSKETPPPVMIHQDGNKYLEPEGNSGAIYLKKNDKVILYCSGGFIFSAKHQRLDAKCLGSNKYQMEQIPNPTRTLFELKCNGLPQHTTKRNGKCLGKKRKEFGTNVQIGFQVDGLAFLPVMEVCHDEKLEKTHYSKFRLGAGNAISQIDGDRPPFTKGGFYKTTNINGSYTQLGQIETITQLLGDKKANEFVQLKNHTYLSRGHLMAKVDLIYGDLQRATFYYINAAPQWQPINAGNWEWTEASLRSFVGAESVEVEVITGTIGVLQLPDCNNKLIDIYLNVGGKNINTNQNCVKPPRPLADKGIRTNPVPMFFYKMVVNKAARTGVVFISLNHPRVTANDFAAKVAALCTDVVNEINWIKYDQNPRRGFIAACNVDEFTKRIDHLPESIGTGITALLLRKSPVKVNAKPKG